MRTINEIIVHCSDSDIASHDNIETIRSWHVQERGFNDVGYHYVITKDGIIHVGRPLDQIGAHCKGKNRNSIGICLTGKDPRRFTDKQYSSLAILCRKLMEEHGIELVNGHYKYSDKQCPNFNVDTWKEFYL